MCRSSPTLCRIVLRWNLVLLRWPLLLPLVILVLLLLRILLFRRLRVLVDVFVVRVMILLSVLHVLRMVLCLRRMLLLLGVRQVLVRMVLPRHRHRPLPAAILMLLMAVHCTVPRRGRRPGRPPTDRRALIRRRPVVVLGGQEMSFLRPGTGSTCAAAAADRPPLLLACLTLSIAGPVCRRSHVVGRGEITAAVAFVLLPALRCGALDSPAGFYDNKRGQQQLLVGGHLHKKGTFESLVWPSHYFRNRRIKKKYFIPAPPRTNRARNPRSIFLLLRNPRAWCSLLKPYQTHTTWSITLLLFYLSSAPPPRAIHWVG